MKAMILAAGFGTRLQPYSLLRPKPLFPVLNTPLLLHTIARLQAAGFDEIGVNCHHLGVAIQDELQGIGGVKLFFEETVLGTGGGLKNAESWFAGEPVLVTNGDIYHDFDFAKIMQHHCHSGYLATLVCHHYPRFNKVSLGREHAIQQFSPCPEAETLVAFTGIHVLNPEVLSAVTPGFSSIIDCYTHWLSLGEVIQAMVIQDHLWMDMGTPTDYLDLHEILLRKQTSPFLVHPSVHRDDVEFKDWVSVGANASLGAGATLERVVVWDGGVVEAGVHLKDMIVT